MGQDPLIFSVFNANTNFYTANIRKKTTFRGPFSERCQFQKPVHLIQFPHRYIPQDREKLNGEKYLKHIRRKDIWGPRHRIY